MMYQATQQLRQQQQQQQQQQQMNMNNMSNNMNRITPYNLNNENGIKTRLPNLRYHVFISKETTKELSDYILPEPWGEENGLLYKYLDYVWRCQLFDGEIKKFYCRNEGKLVFHSGLQRRSDGEFVYLLLIRNDADSQKKVDQKWRVALGIQNGLHSRNMSFVTKEELLKHYWPNHDMLGQLLPKRTLFYQSEKDLIFNRGYRFEIDWEERLRTCKNRIYKTLSNYGNRKGSSNNIDEHILPLTELQRRFESETSKSILMSRANPRIGVPQAFIESKNGGYRLELLIPLTLYYMNRTYYFALALRPHHEQKIYEGMSILTREMAYANARLVGTIDSCWLTTKFASDNHGPAQHCSCTCHTYCNQGINPMHIHNLSDHKRKYQNDIPHDPDHNHNHNQNNHKNACKNNKNIQTNNVPLLNKSHSIDSNPYLNNCNNPNNNNNRNPRNNPTQNRIQYTPINTMINQYNPYNGMNTANRTNPFSFVQTNNANNYCRTATANANSINPYSANNAYQNSFNLSILTNPAFIATSVPNVANVANVNVAHHVSPSRVHNHNISKMIPFINNMNNMNNMNVANASLAAYGIPTIGPLTTNMPVAQISGPQSIGSSVPIYPNQHPQQHHPQQHHPQIINAFSNTVNTINSINKHFNQNNNYYHQYHNHNNPNQNKIIVIKPKETTVCIISNEETQAKKDQSIQHNNNDSKPKIEENPNEHNNNIDNGVEDEKKIEAEAEEDQIEEEVEEETETEQDEEDDDEEEEAVKVEVEPLGVEVESDAVPEQKGFTDDMFADASPRTKELFDGLNFDEEDEVYSLGTPPIKSHNKKAIPRAKSFHTNLHHPDLYTVNNRKSSSYGSLRNKYNESLQQQHSRYMTMTGRDTSPFHLKSIDDTARQHSHDGIHGIQRTKSEQNIVLANAHNNYHNRYGNNEDSNNQNNQNQNLMYQEYYYQAPQPDYTSNDSTLYASDFHNQSGLYYNNNNNNNNENDKNLKARMIKSHSLPSLKVVNDMMSMHSQHQQFQQFQQLNQQKQTQHHQHEQLASPIQENHATQMIDIYGD